jgi:hypothetical protein
MNKHPVKRRPRVPATIHQNGVDVFDTARAGSAFSSFRYSSIEISTRGATAHVKAKHARLEDGKMSAEQFEGDLDRATYERWAEQTQRALAAHASLLFNSLTWFLPFSGKRSRDRD